MKKRIVIIVVCIAVLFTAIGVGASIIAGANNLTQDDIRFLRGYAGDKGDWSIEGNKINLNGSGVVSSAQKIVWDTDKLENEAGIEFTVTYNQDYSSVGATYEDYRFAVALMDSQNFQGSTSGKGIGGEYRLFSSTVNIRFMVLTYAGSEENQNLTYPGRNLGSGIGTASSGVSVKGKIYYKNGTWHYALVKSGSTSYTTVADFQTTDVNYPTNLINGEEAYIVFGSYNANKMNMSISIDNIYGGFKFTDDVTYTDTVTRVGENIALEDNILTRFYVKYSSYDMIAKGGNVNLTCGDKSVNYELIDGTLLEGLTYSYTIPVPAALGTETITLTVQSDALDGEENPVWSETWSTTVKDYCDTLKANNAGTDDKSVALRALCDSINDYCSKAKAYFDLVNASN